jgi:hypothetical protein
MARVLLLATLAVVGAALLHMNAPIPQEIEEVVKIPGAGTN